MNATEVIKIRDKLKALRAPVESHWNELAEAYTPFRHVSPSYPAVIEAERMFDSTGRQAAGIFANGLCSLVIPREEQWFEFVPPDELKGRDRVVKHYRECSEIAHTYVESSAFYEEIQQAIQESGIYATCSLYCGELDEATGELCFLHQPVGTFYIDEDSKGRVNTHLRELRLTPDQAAEEFGVDKLPRKIASRVGKPDGRGEKFEFLHLVCPRIGKPDADAPEAEKRPWVDIVVSVDGKHVVRESGLHEFPFAVHRFSKVGGCVYGFGPGALALGDQRQLSFLNELADVGTEKEVFPPLVATADLEGEIAQGALEVTYTDPNVAGSDVKELHSRGRYDILKDRLGDKRSAVNEAFHVDLFKLFSLRSQERAPLTATEASLIAGEKLTQFSPVYGRFMNEMIDRVLVRVFAVLYRAGKFPAPPQEVLDLQGRNGGKIRYKNKVALAMQAKENGALVEFFSLMLPVLQAFPELGRTIFNSYRPEVLIRDLIRNSGQPERWIASLEEFQQKEAAQAAAMQERAKLENAKIGSEIGANVAKLPPGVAEQAAASV